MIARLEQKFFRSVMMYISMSITLIISVALVNIFFSYWITELVDKDSQMINLSGSMRMQTYHIGLALADGDFQGARSYIDKLDNTWNHGLFSLQRESDIDEPVDYLFANAFDHWVSKVRPILNRLAVEESDQKVSLAFLDEQEALIDRMVSQFQLDAEQRLRALRMLQLTALMATILMGSLIFYLLKDRVDKPLRQLTQAAQRIGKGNYGYQVDVSGNDELTLLGSVFNQMSSSIGRAYEEQEERIRQRTKELQNKNTSLEFLFKNSRKILDGDSLDYQYVVDKLSAILGDLHLNLSLFGPGDDCPYLQVAAPVEGKAGCAEGRCQSDQSSTFANQKINKAEGGRFPIIHNQVHFGVIGVARCDAGELLGWQRQLLQSAADQLAMALALGEQRSQERRLAMLHERAVIARELHDSLAQALSYLQIQVVRLQKSVDSQRYDLQQLIIEELREGLASAYRQLRELLTTFRLKIDSGGLCSALENTVNQLRERSDVDVELNYQLGNIPLTPMEEIHLLQIVREAGQNAIHHSRGKKARISLTQEDKNVLLTVDDDGIGIPSKPEKLNHYGIAIMNERARHLGSQVEISQRAEGGTRVRFEFTPVFRRERVR